MGSFLLVLRPRGWGSSGGPRGIICSNRGCTSISILNEEVQKVTMKRGMWERLEKLGKLKVDWGKEVVGSLGEELVFRKGWGGGLRGKIHASPVGSGAPSQLIGRPYWGKRVSIMVESHRRKGGDAPALQKEKGDTNLIVATGRVETVEKK